MIVFFFYFFFFFQAEDGIRDLTVTGVQTYALPISGELKSSEFSLFLPHEAKRKVSILSASCFSTMNFARELLSAVVKRNSGRLWRSAWATTNSEGGMPGRMVRSQEPKEFHTACGKAAARYCSNPWQTTPAWMKTW